MSTITVKANGQPLDLEITGKGIHALVPSPGVRVGAPEGYFVISGRTTIDYVMDEEKLPLRKWQHISTGPLFKELFQDIFEGSVEIPASLIDLHEAAPDIQHISGMIILMFECMAERGIPVYLDFPETHLHPAQARCLVGMLEKMNRVCQSIRNESHRHENTEL